MAITFDAAGVTSSSGSGFTLNHTIGGGTGRLLIVTFSFEGLGGVSPATATRRFNGVDLIAGPKHLGNAEATTCPIETWYLLDASLPAAGTYAVTATFVGSSVGNGVVVSVISLAGVKQDAPEATTTSHSGTDGTTYSTNLTTITNDAWIVDAIAGGNPQAWTATASGQVERVDRIETTNNSHSQAVSTKPVASAGSSAMSWTAAATQSRFTHALLAFAPAPPIVAFTGKAATATSARATRTIRTARFVAKSATSTSARASLRTTRRVTGKAATATSARATSIRRSRRLTAKSATATSARATLVRRSRPFAAKLSTSTSARALTVVRSRRYTARAAVATSARAAPVRRSRSFAARAATSTSARATSVVRSRRYVARAAIATSARADLTVTEPAGGPVDLAGKAATATSARAAVRTVRRFDLDVAVAISARATFDRGRTFVARAPIVTNAYADLRVIGAGIGPPVVVVDVAVPVEVPIPVLAPPAIRVEVDAVVPGDLVVDLVAPPVVRVDVDAVVPGDLAVDVVVPADDRETVDVVVDG